MNPPPGRAIQNLDQDRAALAQRVHDFDVECLRIEENWTALLAQGGGSPDHAAAMLGALRGHLGAITSLCYSVDRVIARMIDRPFD